MEKLGRYLAPSQGKLESKGVASVRSRVVNLSQVQPGLTVSHMEEALWAAFSEVYGLPTRRLGAVPGWIRPLWSGTISVFTAMTGSMGRRCLHLLLRGAVSVGGG